MNSDELQHLASILRWSGLAITALGVCITFGSHYIADKLIVVQQSDKIKAQERLKVTESELEQTKQKTVELTKRLSPRALTTEQRERFIKILNKATKGPIILEHSGQAPETMKFATEIRSLLTDAGFAISAYNMPLGYVFDKAPEPWFLTVIVIDGAYPEYANQLILAFKEIGINVLLGNGVGISNPGEVKILVGAKH